jgi:Na+/proline symporter
MLHDWGVIATAFSYIGLLFFVAHYGDRLSPTQRGRASPYIYPLSLAIYCTSWTFFGSVGFATRTSSPKARTSPRSPTSSARVTARARRLPQPWH